jgi:DNA-binding SARP family transcriptional activator
MDPQVTIKLLGRFDVLIDNRSVGEGLSKTKKGQALLQYLLLNYRGATSNTRLCEALWPKDHGSGNPENALKTLVSRVRAQLIAYDERLGACIVTERNAYRWNSSLDIDVDLFAFERLCLELQSADTLTPKRKQKFEEAVELYAGDLLPGAAGEEWVQAHAARLRQEYLALIHRYIALLQQAKDFETVARVCRTALDLEAFDEQLHVALMDALVRSNRGNEALLQYQHITDMHARYLDGPPPEGIRAFYDQIVRSGQTLDSDLDAIAQDLRTKDPQNAAFVCDYAVFKEYYGLQVRMLERPGAVLFLALIMVGGRDYQPVNPLLLEEVMKDLLDVLRINLRKGDTIARYGTSKYALLLPCDRADRGKAVLERVKRTFYGAHADAPVSVSYRISVLKELGNR